MVLVGVVFDVFVVKKLVLEKLLDVIMFDIEMFKVDGLCFLEVLMNVRLMFVVMIFMLIEKGVDVMLRFLELGVIDFVVKFKIGVV